MGNSKDTNTSRTEELAFLVIEQIIEGVNIELADAGTGNSMPDGYWVYPSPNARTASIEVTSPDSSDEIREYVQHLRKNSSGDIPEIYYSTFSWEKISNFQKVQKILQNSSFVDGNIKKFGNLESLEKHLYLYTSSFEWKDIFDGLFYEIENHKKFSGFNLPEPLTDLWVQGSTSYSRNPTETNGVITGNISHFNIEAGWRLHNFSIEEDRLPAPKLNLARFQNQYTPNLKSREIFTN